MRYIALFVSLALSMTMGSSRAETLHVYSYLSPGYIGPVLEAFEAETGIPVTVEYMTASDLLARLKEEGDQPGADVVFTLEAKRLAALAAAGVLTPVRSDVLTTAIPAQHRHSDGLWFGLSKWVRTVFYAKDRVNPASLNSYLDLIDPKWRGRICVRPSNKIYVQSLVASIIAHEGEATARRFVQGIVANMAREPIDLDIEQIKGVADGICDIAVANSYYYARLKPLVFDVITGTQSSGQTVLDKVGVHYLEQDGRGVHTNISGFAMTRSTRNRNAAVQLMEYMVRPSVQRLYADGSKDSPIVSGLKPHFVLQELGTYKEDVLPIESLNEHYSLAEKISREEGWLWK